MNSPCSGLLESIINSYLSFDIFHFFPFSVFLWLLQLGLYIIPFTLQMESKGRPFYSDRPWQTALWYYSTSYCGCNHRISLWTVQHHLGSSCWSCRQWQIRQLRSGLCTDKMSSSSCRPVCSWQVCLLLFFLILRCLSCVLFVAFQHISLGPQDISFRVTCKPTLASIHQGRPTWLWKGYITWPAWVEFGSVSWPRKQRKVQLEGWQIFNM